MAATARYWNGRIRLETGQSVAAHLHDSCAAAGTCVCGFCKGNGQCQFGDCRGEIVAEGATLCTHCSASPWKVALPGHRAGVAS